VCKYDAQINPKPTIVLKNTGEKEEIAGQKSAIENLSCIKGIMSG
jgi:hypothetical protein